MQDDLISRQAAIDAINEMFAKCQARDRAIDAVKSVPITERKKAGWIPCSERLPEEKMDPNTSDFELVICTTTFGDVRAYRFGTPIGWNEPHFWNGIGIMDGYVLAWMYLPEPWKGENDV